MTGKTASKGNDQAQIERFKALAREVGADKPSGLDAAVRKLAKAGPIDRKPIQPRKVK